MAGLKKSGIVVNRKALAELAVHDSAAFGQLLAVAKDSLGSNAA